MDFSFTPDQEIFRAELRAWLERNLPPGWTRDRVEAGEASTPEQVATLRRWMRQLYEGGWSGLHWPREFGGRGATIVEQVIFSEEMARFGAPEILGAVGLEIIGPTIMAHGTEEQKRRFLPKILSGEEIWCQGFSEPNAGSDLAGLQTRAELDGDEWVVNGSKIWTSGAQFSDWCTLLCRTDPDAPKHRGISMLVVDLKSPGIRIQPVRQMTGESGFNQVFFEGVRVPRENLLGELNRGWQIAQDTLGFERGPITLSIYIGYKRDFDDLLAEGRVRDRLGAPALAAPEFRERIAASYIDLEIMRLNGYRILSEMLHGRPPGANASPLRLHWGATAQRLFTLAIELLGPHGQLAAGDRRAPRGGRYAQRFLFARSRTIAGGTAQIQRNVIAERLLGMPR
jgi:alkylation response protein AidB-like acyl-CoA dehydrogenase